MANPLCSYASKLPDKCAYINKKFGGGRAILGPKVPSTTPRPSKTARERRVASKRPTGLTRTLTGTSISSRGTTAEPLSLIAAEGTAVKTVRGGTLSSRNFSKQIVEVAEKKPAQKKVDEELRSVIQALKRPNRGAAAAELVDDAERRLAKPVSRNSKLHYQFLRLYGCSHPCRAHQGRKTAGLQRSRNCDSKKTQG